MGSGTDFSQGALMTTGNILITSDWQMRTQNLQQVEDLVARLHEIAAAENVISIVHLGDVKEHLNPVDLRVTNAAMRAIVSFRLKEIAVYVLKGNHDAASYADESETWLPSLQAAGACTIDQPVGFSLNGLSCFFVPFMRSKDGLEKVLITTADKCKPRALFLHASIEGAYNNGVSVAGSDAVARAVVERYPLVISGHIHMPQSDKTKRIWYVGSPFAVDWGEVNQRKRVLLLNPKTGVVKSIWLDFPGLFDPSLPDFPQKVPAGSTVRIRYAVPPNETEASAAVPVRAKAVKCYPNCQIVTEPLEEDTAVEVQDVVTDESDAAAIAAYCTQAIPDALRDDVQAVVHDIVVKLSESGAVVRQTEELQFIGFEAKNVLMFEHIKYEFKKGVTLVSGCNHDWDGRSNGAGKTNFLQLPLIALSGKTSKGQTADGWRRNGSKGESWVKLHLEVGAHSITIQRGREPKGVRVFVDGADVTRGKEPETQRQIEELTGITWDVAVTSLWVDQRRANKLLHGQDAERKTLLSQFLNLERFSKAQVLAKQQRDTRAAALQQAQADLAAEQNSVATLEQAVGTSIDEDALRTAQACLEKAQADLAEMEETVRTEINRLRKEAAAAEEEIAEAQRRKGVAATKLGAAQKTVDDKDTAIHKARKLDVAECPTCGAELDRKAVKERITSLQAEKEAAAADVEDINKRIAGYKDTIIANGDKLQSLVQRERKAQDRLVALRYEVRTAQAEVGAAARLHAAMLNTRTALYVSRQRLEVLAELVKTHAYNLDVDKFIVSALGKNGIPAFLMARACPRLNRAARRYSRLVSNGVIQVQFALDDRQDIAATVLNTQGGTEVEDQSVGETTSAVLVVALALRDIMLPCNVLIADEPGDGLDEAGAKALAKVLRDLSRVYRSVLVTTHNPHIMAELSDCRVRQIVKKNKISTCQ